jgi:large subunit ribosomal protein L33
MGCAGRHTHSITTEKVSAVTMPREIIALECTSCKRNNYSLMKNKRKHSERLEIKKYCPFERKRTVHKEAR